MNNMSIMDPIPQIVNNCLNNFAYNDAIFLSERFHSESQSEESLYLLSLCYHRANKILRAYHLLKQKYLTLPQSKYLLSKCCIDLNKHGEAETILTECTLSKQKLYDEIVKEYGDYSCFVLQILALVYSKTDRIPQAIEFHKKCLRLNPFLWSSFEALCNFGEKIDPAKYFTSLSAINFYNSQIRSNINSYYYNQENNNNLWLASSETGKLSINYSQEPNYNLNDLFTMKENSVNEQDEQFNCNSSNASVTSSNSCGGVTSLSNFTYNLQQNLAEVQNETIFSTDSKYFDEDNSINTPPQLISTVINKGPFPKKLITKRLPIKPLCGQNTGNLANIALSNTSSSTSNQVRRSSRIFAQSATQSANAVKENKKILPTLSKHTNNNPLSSNKDEINHKNKKFKVKKKIDISGSGLDDSVAPSSSNNSQDISINNNQVKSSSSDNSSTILKNISENTHYSEETNFYLTKNVKTSEFIDENQKNKIDNMMKIFRDFGNGYSNLTQYELKKALDNFESLPATHYQSSYILSAIGKVFFELHDYQKAEKIYLKLRQLHPYHLEGIEYYSTVLWHLQKEITLSSLSQELTDYDKLAPETWCVVGNCFSLHKEHDAAIKFFQRATQINSEFVYAYNLLGHEYFLIEEMEKGLSCFRKAIFLDPRHYNAWYGISMINLKQEKFLLAEKYLKRALIINPNSSTLMCHIAVVYHSMKKSEKALEILDRALELEPKNFLCKFHRASIFFSMEKYDLALIDFEKLRRQIPKESLIYYMISKTHKKLRNIQLSLMFMSWAMDLDPKGVNNQLKESIDKRYVVDNDSTFARELESMNTLSLDSIYGSEGVESIILANNEQDANNNVCIDDNANNNYSIENDNEDEPCPSLYVNTLSNLLSVHHITPKLLDTTLILSTASSSGSTIISPKSKELSLMQTTHEAEENTSLQLQNSNSQIEEQLMDLQEDT